MGKPYQKSIFVYALGMWLLGLFNQTVMAQHNPPWPKRGDTYYATFMREMSKKEQEKLTFFLKRPDEVLFEFDRFLEDMGRGMPTIGEPNLKGWVACYGTGFKRKRQPVRIHESWVPHVETNPKLRKSLFGGKPFPSRTYSNGAKMLSVRDFSRAQRGYTFGIWVKLPSERKLESWTKRLNAIDLELEGKPSKARKKLLLLEMESLEERAYPALMAEWYALEREVWQQAFSPGQWVHEKHLPLYKPGTPRDSLESEIFRNKMLCPADLDYRFQLKVVYVVDRDENGEVVNIDTHIRRYDEAAAPLKVLWARKFGKEDALRNVHFFRRELAIEEVKEEMLEGGISRKTQIKYHFTRKPKEEE